ncbi:MAG: alpha/beta hydrolase [Candidatus Eremiobacteraeota bacterium]|nr:alpha/beta hydrolase [Candidatus Eremiobacteraeota bacterium]
MRNIVIFVVMVLLLSVPVLTGVSSADSWTPRGGAQQVPLWSAHSPVLAGGIRTLEDPQILAEKPVTNVSNPTYTVYYPRENPSGTCIVIFPGGGHLSLAMGLEGTEIADWLTRSGITCVLVKYRVPYSGCYWDSKLHRHVTPKVPMALQDAQRAISILRARAQEYHINPDKIGVMGFSAGGNVVVLASTRFQNRSYKPLDSIDQVSCRPDFAVPVYPGHMTMSHKNVDSRALNSDIVISRGIPPTLLIHAKDDPVDPVHYSEVYAAALRKVGVSVTLKLYKSGGHAFGVRKQDKDSDRWTEDVIAWLQQLKIL